MKKGVVFLLLISILIAAMAISAAAKVTSLQVLDLPPPPPPGTTETSQPQTVSETPPPIEVPSQTVYASEILNSLPSNVSVLEARVETIEGKVQAVNLLPQFEQRLNTVEQQAAVASEVSGQVDTLSSEVSALKVQIQNLQQRPYVEQPAFTGGIAAVEQSVKKNSILSISLSVLTLLIVAGMIVFILREKHKETESDKENLTQYVSTYLRKGYQPETLRGHLIASGWDEKLVDEAMQANQYF